jgi:hypothetical protein
MSGARKSGRRTTDSNVWAGEINTPSARLKNESSGNSSGRGGAIIDSLMIHSSVEFNNYAETSRRKEATPKISGH